MYTERYAGLKRSQADIAEVIEKDSLTSTSGIFQLPQVALMISPTSTYEDVKSALRDAQLLYKTDKRLYYYKHRVDTVGNIRKYRYFYWKRVEGLKLDKIASDWVESQLPKEDYTTFIEVSKGLKVYQKLLEQ